MIYCKQPIGETTAWFKMPSKKTLWQSWSRLVAMAWKSEIDGQPRARLGQARAEEVGRLSGSGRPGLLGQKLFELSRHFPT